MKSPHSIDVYELQFKIDEKLHEIKKRNIQPRNSSTKNKDDGKVMHYVKWNAIKRRLQKPKETSKDLVVVKPQRKVEDLMDIINRIILLEKSLIELSKNISNYRRLQMGCIFFQCSLSIVFNAYNLVVFLLKIANGADDVPLSLFMLLFFYGYHIITSLADVIVSIMSYNGVFETIRKTASQADELNMYILDAGINARISQLSTYVYNNLRVFTLYGLYNLDGSLITSILAGTTTYIIILIQYSGDGEICKNADNLHMDANQNLT
ncbi:putative gustatory receptor 28b [Calliphora vicina]|uniref:putative gustatory receptor 28b n=1 Tax=Calliphora vicina TaxID=7373 RepID=UPI00325BA31E